MLLILQLTFSDLRFSFISVEKIIFLYEPVITVIEKKNYKNILYYSFYIKNTFHSAKLLQKIAHKIFL